MRHLRRLAATALALIAAAALAAGGAACTEGTGADGPLRVGLEPKYPPFETTDAAGNCIGFDVDLARALAQALGREAKFVPMDFDPLVPELEAGRIDLVCSGMSYTAERAVRVDFTRPYLHTSMGVLVSREKAAAVQTIADLDAPGMVIAVQRGTTGETKAKEAFPRAKVEPYDTEVDAASQVEAARAHAFVYDMASVRKLAERAGDRVRVLEGDLGAEDYCIAFPKGSPHVAKANAFLDGASRPGGLIDQLIERWKPTAEPVRPGESSARPAAK